MKHLPVALALCGVAALAAAQTMTFIKCPEYIQGGAQAGTPGAGVPMAVLVGVRPGLTDTAYQYKPRLLAGTSAAFYFWVDQTSENVSTQNTWQADGVAYTGCPILRTNSNPNDTAKVWTAVKTFNDVAGQKLYARLYGRLKLSGTTISGPISESTYVLNVTTGGNGGWLAGHVYASMGGPALQNYVVLAYGHDSIVGSYITENNQIIEGYSESDAGYFLMAVRSGQIDSLQLYARTEYVNPSTHYTEVSKPWTVVPGETTWVDLPVVNPVISEVTRDQQYPFSWENVVVSARITLESGTLDVTEIQFSTDRLTWTSADEDSTKTGDPDLYYFHVPPQDPGDSLHYRIHAVSLADGEATSAVSSYLVPLDLSIYDVQYTAGGEPYPSPYDNQRVHVAGVVTGVVTNRLFYIQEAAAPWRGVPVYVAGGHSVAPGDSVDINGVADEFSQMTEIYPNRIDVNGTDVAFDTLELTVTEAQQEQYEGLCVRLDSVWVQDPTGVFVVGSDTIDNFDHTDEISLYVTSGSAFVNTPQPLGPFIIVSNLGDHTATPNLQLIPRYPTDITLLVDVAADQILEPKGTLAAGVEVAPRVRVSNADPTTDASNVMVKVKVGTYEDQETIGTLLAGQTLTLAFDPWTTVEGEYVVELSVSCFGDPNPDNDVITENLRVVAPGASAWTEVLNPMPSGPLGKDVKDGGWLAGGEGPQDGERYLYAAKGNKTSEFYRYDTEEDTWVTLESIPADEGGKVKRPAKGCASVVEGSYIYMVKGNNTFGFWRYDIDRDSWSRLPDVPPGPELKAVKGGGDLAYVKTHGSGPDTGYVYLLKGYRNEFYRFNTVTMSWDTTLPGVPYGGSKPKYDRGSFLAFASNPGRGRYDIWAHQAKYTNVEKTNHFMYHFNVDTKTWDDTLKGMPLAGMYGGKMKNKKSKDGGAGVWEDDLIYALKGGNTCQFYRYYVEGDSWEELDTIPSYGSTLKKRRVKNGGDLAGTGNGMMYALKGNKTRELWRYGVPALQTSNHKPQARCGVMANPSTIYDVRMTISPNPLANGYAMLCYSVPKPGPVSVTVFDVAGRSVWSTRAPGHLTTGALPLDTRSLSAGVYLVRLDTDGFSSSQKLVVQK